MSNARNIADVFSKSTAISTDTEVSTAVVTERTTVATLSGKTLLAPAMTNIIITPSSTTSTPITINGIVSQSGDYLNINTLATGGTNLIKIDVNGNVGLGKTPGVKLDVNGVVNATGFTIGGTSIITPAATPTTLGTVIGKVSSNGYDTFIGVNSGNSATSQFNINTGMGNYALNGLVYGTGNTAVGQSALTQMTGNSNVDQVNSNTAIGSLSGFGFLYGSNNTMLGSQAGYNTLQGSNNILIGYNANASSASVSNEITLGNANITSFRIPGLGASWSTTNLSITGSLTSTETIKPTKGLIYSINPQPTVGTTYTAALTDAGSFVTMNNSAANTFYLNTDTAINFPIGSSINIIQIGTGTTTIQATTPATTTIGSTGATSTAPKIRTQYASATAIKISANLWYVVGDLV